MQGCALAKLKDGFRDASILAIAHREAGSGASAVERNDRNLVSAIDKCSRRVVVHPGASDRLPHLLPEVLDDDADRS